MTISWISKPRFVPILITLFIALQISACSTEDLANAISDNVASETSGGTTTTGPSEPSPSPTPGPTPGPTPEPVTAVAMYSYNANLTDAQPLTGAELEQTTVYMFFESTSQYSSINFYCCKGTTNASTGEPHNAAVRDSSAPFVHAVDLSQYSTAGTRELYVDITRIDGTGIDSLAVNFNINITSAPTDPVPTPGPGPTADINLSWVAPAEREDNTAILLSEIASYKIYYGTAQGNYNNSIKIDDGSADSHTFNDFSSGTYYFVITTVDTDGRESQHSSEVIISI